MSIKYTQWNRYVYEIHSHLCATISVPNDFCDNNNYQTQCEQPTTNMVPTWLNYRKLAQHPKPWKHKRTHTHTTIIAASYRAQLHFSHYKKLEFYLLDLVLRTRREPNDSKDHTNTICDIKRAAINEDLFATSIHIFVLRSLAHFALENVGMHFIRGKKFAVGQTKVLCEFVTILY